MKYGLITDMSIGMDFMSNAKTHRKKVSISLDEHTNGKQFLCKESTESVDSNMTNNITIQHINKSKNDEDVYQDDIKNAKIKTKVFDTNDRIGIG